MTVTIYTDGSCNTLTKVGGWASFIFIDNEKIVLKGRCLNTTHQRMELHAVVESLAYAEAKVQDDDCIIVYSDSQYVVGIKNRKSKMLASNFLTKKSQPISHDDLVRKLISHIENLNVTFIKVRAHEKKTNEQNFNREVDKLARQIVRQHKDER